MLAYDAKNGQTPHPALQHTPYALIAWLNCKQHPSRYKDDKSISATQVMKLTLSGRVNSQVTGALQTNIEDILHTCIKIFI